MSQRRQHAQEALLALTPPPGRGRRQFSERAPLHTAVDAILKRYQVADLLTVIYDRQESQRLVRQYKDRPARTETTVRYQIRVTPDWDAIELVHRRLGWRLFVTNSAPTQLSLEDAVCAYREGPLHEQTSRDSRIAR